MIDFHVMNSCLSVSVLRYLYMQAKLCVVRVCSVFYCGHIDMSMLLFVYVCVCAYVFGCSLTLDN